MKRSFKKGLLLVFIIIAFTSNIVFGQAIVDTKNLQEGVIGIQYVNPSPRGIKVMIEKDGTQYVYNLNNQTENFSLQMGNGDYTVRLLENTEGNKYRVIFTDTINLKMKEEKSVFLASVQMINWNTSMESIKKAKELVKNAKNDVEKVEKIYQYIVSNIEYDYEKAKRVTPGYLPKIDNTFTDNKAICFDYASLFAAMLRSVGVPTKLVMGYAPDVEEYHAWNEVYIESKGQWFTIDTTVDAQYNKANKKVDMFKNSSLYKKAKEY